MPKVGVLALQGDVIEHVQMLRRLGAKVIEVRLPEQLADLDGLVIPGGESTTIGKLAVSYGLIESIKAMAKAGTPIWGTCAGLILLARDIARGRATDIGGGDQPLIGMMDVVVSRNAFGRQVDSFEVELDAPALVMPDEENRPFHAVFIRAPAILRVGPGVEVLATLDDGTIVAARQDNLLATAFHPELTNDTRWHRYFLHMVERASKA